MACVDNGEANLKITKKAELLRQLELGLIRDEEIKLLISSQLEKRLQWGYKPTFDQQLAQLLNFVQCLRQMSMSTKTDALNSQMYETPISFLKLKYGKAMKASWGYFEDDLTTLDDAEVAMLELYCKRAEIKDGQRVLDLGCGYGALIIYIACKYPDCHVTGITNSASQKSYIEQKCRDNNLVNVEVKLADIIKFEMDDMFDRVMAIQLLEHMENYELLLRKISKWMKEDGLLFVDHICHKTFAYHFKAVDEDDWLEECIFPQGTMTIPSSHFLLYFQDGVSVVNHWTINGKHVSRTNEEWLRRLDSKANHAKAIIEDFMGNKEEAMKWYNNSRTRSLFLE